MIIHSLFQEIHIFSLNMNIIHFYASILHIIPSRRPRPDAGAEHLCFLRFFSIFSPLSIFYSCTDLLSEIILQCLL